MTRREERNEAANTLADTLDEERGGVAWWGLRFIYKRLGEKKIAELVQETIRIESSGGMMTLDGSRKRTTGGVFFHLAKKRIGRIGVFALKAYVTKKMGAAPTERPENVRGAA